jgi:VTC domain.
MSNRRFELKFPIHKSMNFNFNTWIRSFVNMRETYYQRTVNSIYYDSNNKSSARDNLGGFSNRSKFRLRWYGEGDEISKCILEIKTKKGRVGKKINIPTDKYIYQLDIKNIFNLKNCYFTDKKKEEVLSFLGNIILRPSLKISYLRSYYMINKQIRITYDKNITYENFIFRSKKKDELEVCEIKFLEKDYKYFYNLIKSLPLTNKRFSKY